jgi:hypothetical protein
MAILGNQNAAADMELRRLAATLAISAQAGVRVPATLAKYAPAWKQFTEWVALRQQYASAFDVPGNVVALYLWHVLETSQKDGIGPSRVLTASHAIAFNYKLHGLPAVTAHALCGIVRELAARKLHGTVINKDPIDAVDFKALLAMYAGPAANLMDLMHVTAFLVMYAGFLCYDEVAEVCVHSDMLRISSTHMDIFIPRSKTDQHWEGKWVSIARVGGNLCPVGLVERLLTAGGYVRTPPLPNSDVGPLIRHVANTRGRHCLKQYLGTLNKPIMSTSYDRLRQRMRDMCAAAGVTKHITLHSMRIGGITAAAEKGVPDRLLMKHGRCRIRICQEPLHSGVLAEHAACITVIGATAEQLSLKKCEGHLLPSIVLSAGAALRQH